jgi:hypothetical protein
MSDAAATEVEYDSDATEVYKGDTDIEEKVDTDIEEEVDDEDGTFAYRDAEITKAINFIETHGVTYDDFMDSEIWNMVGGSMSHHYPHTDQDVIRNWMTIVEGLENSWENLKVFHEESLLPAMRLFNAIVEAIEAIKTARA